MKLLLSVVLVLAVKSNAVPVSQPGYSNPQYIAAQYRQPQQVYAQPQYVTSKPVLEERGEGLQKYSTQIKQAPQVYAVPSSVDRQVQRVAQQASYPQPQALLRPAQPQYVQQAPQHTQVKYVRPQPQAYRPAPEQIQETPEEYDPNPSYQFGFDVNDDLYTNYQNRKEQRDGNKITGSYSVVDSDGFVRTVTYTADPKEGFKAEVTRQPTDIVVKIPKPDPQFQHQYIQPQQARAPIQRPNPAYQYQE